MGISALFLLFIILFYFLNDMKVSKWWQNFHFWVNYPFNFTKYKLFVGLCGIKLFFKIDGFKQLYIYAPSCLAK